MSAGMGKHECDMSCPKCSSPTTVHYLLGQYVPAHCGFCGHRFEVRVDIKGHQPDPEKEAKEVIDSTPVVGSR